MRKFATVVVCALFMFPAVSAYGKPAPKAAAAAWSHTAP